jgi:hypothetical protein
MLLVCACLAVLQVGCDLGKGTTHAERSAGPVGAPARRVTEAQSRGVSVQVAPSEDWGVPELLARELAEPEVETSRDLSGAGEEALPRTPLDPEAAARHLARAWKNAAGRPLGEEGLAVLWSHWALETARGERMVGYNFGGLKGHSPAGESVRLWTRERHDDELALVRRRFRAYTSPEDGARDYVELLRERYPRARRAVERGSVVDFVLGLAERGYFTDDPDRYLRAMRSLGREFLEHRARERRMPDRRASEATVRRSRDPGAASGT